MKKIWISGASTGIGRALTLEALSRGLSVIATSRNTGNLESLAEEAASANLFTSTCDVSDPASIRNFFNNVLKGEAPDILINCAGITTFKEAKDTTFEEVEAIIRTNLTGAVHAIQTVLPGMIERGSGAIVNINSVAALDRLKASSIYSASKAGLLQYSRVLREEVRENNIKVIDILPGATETPIWHEKVRAKYSEKMMQPAGLARHIVNFLSDDSNIDQEEGVFRPVTGNL